MPSTKRKFAFWLLAGMLSVVCVEVPAGSTMFPFWTIWGLLVVWPLYLLHSVFLAAVVFRFGKPRFWTLYAAGMLYGMYEAYITKVIWVSFMPNGPIYSVGGIALLETIVLVLFLHPLLAFVIPLYFTETLLTNSNEIFFGFPRWIRISIRAHPMIWAALLMAMFGLMQFINSSSVWHSLLSGAGNGIVMGLVVRWWRRSGGTNYSLRELLPERKGFIIFGCILLVWYLFWGLAIKPKSIPPILNGQLTVWIMYAALGWIFWRCLIHSRQDSPAQENAVAFSWRGFVWCVVVATGVTCAARLVANSFQKLMSVQMLLFFAFYVIVGFVLLGGAVRYAAGAKTPAVGEIPSQ